MAILSFQAMFFMVRKGVDPSLCSEFLCKSPRVQPHFTLRLAPKRSAFSTKTQCIQHQNTVHLASKRSAFSIKTRCIQRQNAVHLASNGTKADANCGFMQCVFILFAFSTTPFLHQNQPSRESIFCGKVSDWWRKWPVIMLKCMPKTRHLCLRALSLVIRLGLLFQLFQLSQFHQLSQYSQFSSYTSQTRSSAGIAFFYLAS